MAGIVYIHVPKCGGSSFGAALRLRYFYSQAGIDLSRSAAAAAAQHPRATGEHKIIADYDQRRRALAGLTARRVACISGHVRYDGALHDRLGRDYAFVTLLRDPVARFVSHYRYLQRRHPDPDRPATLERFLDTPDAARLGSQYLFYFAGHSQNTSPDLAHSIQAAQAALARFDLVGDLAYPRAFALDLRRLSGAPLIWRHRNRAPVATSVPAALQSRIAALCAPDIAIYRAARAAFVASVAA